MKLSERLRACAELVCPGNVAADVGTDHGYLALYLLGQGICPEVYASDLREGPLSAARRSALRAGIQEHISFVLSDGLQKLPVDRIGTVIIAGMGGDNIISILDREPGVRNGCLQMILQPQSKAAELRRYLTEQGFSILREKLSRDGRFLYTAMEARYTGEQTGLTPGQQLISPALLREQSPLLGEFLSRVRDGVEQSIRGLRQAREPDSDLLSWYETAFRELAELEEQL